MHHSNITTAAAPKKEKSHGFAGLSPKWQKPCMAALQGCAVAALSSGGPWNGAKGAKIASAALAGAFGASSGGASSGGASSGGGNSSSSDNRGRRDSDYRKLGGALGGLLAHEFINKGHKNK
jgi:hypothetical protein